MMDAKTHKLATKLKDPALAAALVEAGLDNPAKIRAASNEALEAISGVGPATRKALRRRFPNRG
jgi:predicted flap endonuclease-1-like 5' DNA nuclease